MTSDRYLDPRSVAGKALHVEERCQVLVVGAGPAGLAAAIEAASLGLRVMLVDENPVPFATMGEDVPLHFGNAMSGLARSRNAMMDAFLAAEPLIEQAFEAGVDVRLETAVWGIYANGDGIDWLPGTLAGLADGERSWLVGCERIIVAAGARDMGLAFPGWEKPGVLGATAALRLARLGALDARSAVLLGSSAEALTAGLALQAAGTRIAAVIEQAEAPVGPGDLVEALRESGAAILVRHVVREAQGGDRVDAIAAAAIEPDGHVDARAPERRIACDAVVLGIGAAPVVDVLDALGCRLAFQPERAGWAPMLGQGQASSIPEVLVAGDAAGVWAAKSRDRTIAEDEGRRAAVQAAAGLGVTARAVTAEPAAPPAQTFDLAAYRLAWVRASVVEARAEPHVCQCEEVTAREILEVRPPRYLGAGRDRRNNRSLRALLGDGPPHPDQVKRLTRAGMGPCQGRRCREQVACLLALGAGSALADIPLAAYRAPVRPLPLAIAGDRREPPPMTEHWDAWFGIAPQYRLARDLPPVYTAATGNPAGPVASE